MADIDEMTLEEILGKVILDLEIVHESQVQHGRENPDITIALSHARLSRRAIEAYVAGIAL